MTYRSRGLLDLAHGINACTIGVPEVCIGYQEHGLEPCHLPKSMLNGGMGLKSDDVFAAGCHPCHVECDQGRRLTRDEKAFYLLRGAARTWAELMRLGWLKVADRAARMRAA